MVKNSVNYLKGVSLHLVLQPFNKKTNKVNLNLNVPEQKASTIFSPKTALILYIKKAYCGLDNVVTEV